MSYDILIAGSDQIWNPLITGGLDSVFLLQFGNASKRISVASSLGSNKPTEEEENIFRKAFEDFSSISVREQYAKNCLQSLTNKNIKVLMDPTFLFNKNEWINLLGKKSKLFDLKEKYILTYFISGKKSSYQDRVLEYSKKLNCPVWSIPVSYTHLEDMGGYYRVAADSRDLNYDKFVVNGEVHTMADESYTSHNTNRLDVEGTVKKILTTDYVKEELEGIRHN